MTDWLSLLLFALLFYVMMRFGCGAHMVHGGHGRPHPTDHDGEGRREAGSTDPVCGMTVGLGQGYSKNHNGQEYRFCSRACLDQFEADPQRYLTPQRGRQ